jgi:hypothetical protein
MKANPLGQFDAHRDQSNPVLMPWQRTLILPSIKNVGFPVPGSKLPIGEGPLIGLPGQLLFQFLAELIAALKLATERLKLVTERVDASGLASTLPSGCEASGAWSIRRRHYAG